MNTITTQLPFKGVMTSNIGGRKENQDTCGYSDTSRGLLLVVCDGMGGGPGGKTASSIAATTLIAYVQQAGSQPDAEGISNETLLHDAIIAANRALRDKIQEAPELDGMGTTVTAVLLSEAGAALAHVGDSRIYQLRRGKIVFRTADHSRVGEMVRAGALTDEQARLSAISNLITRALGIGDEVQVDTTTVSYEKGDRFALCTDGVWGSMPQPELVKAFTENKSLENTADLLNVKVENAGQEKGGHHDNYTMIIVETLAASAPAIKAEATATTGQATVEGMPPMPGKAPAMKLDSRILALIITAAIITPALIFALMYMPMGEAPVPPVEENEQPTDTISQSIDSVKTVIPPDSINKNKPVEPPVSTTANTTETPRQSETQTETPASVAKTTPIPTATTDTNHETQNEQPVAQVPTGDKAALEARKAALTQIIDCLTKMKGYVESLRNSAGKSAPSAKSAFRNAKRNAIKELNKLQNITGYEYTEDEQYMLFANQTEDQLKQSGKYNGIAGALGGETVLTIPDSSGCTIIIKERIDVLLQSMRAKLQETENQLKELN